ncbi:MAG: gliding motility protein GldC [Chitinophagales bacterium]
MKPSTIQIDVYLDAEKVPETINWKAADTSADGDNKAKAMMLAFWDGADKAAMRIDLWTKDMMVDEMGDFYYQSFMTMAETFERATHQEELVNDIRQFAKEFYGKFRSMQLKENTA